MQMQSISLKQILLCDIINSGDFMKIAVAIDSFKGSLSSMEAGNAVKEGILKANKKHHVAVFPLADGGEGTVESFTNATDAEIVLIEVNGPLTEKVIAKYCILRNDNTAIIEASSACGLPLLKEDEKNPMNTTTYGLGEIINDAIKRGCRNFIIGIGGTSTNDGGTGMLSALGFEFLDENNSLIPAGAKGLEKLSKINTDNVIKELSECRFKIACDVNNPLCGKNGCSYVFAPQKGATPEEIEKMDLWLDKYGNLVKNITTKADMNYSGAGAAGGLGFAFLAFTNSILESGAKIILDYINIEEHIKNADIVVTGEGKLDEQTIMGKAPMAVAQLAKKYNKKVIAFSGVVSDNAEICNDFGIDAFFPITRKILSLEQALNKENAYNNLVKTVNQVFRLI